jgi:hypothetical protein
MRLQIASSSVENKNKNVASCMLKLPALILAENVHHSFVTLCICILMKLKKAHKVAFRCQAKFLPRFKLSSSLSFLLVHNQWYTGC